MSFAENLKELRHRRGMTQAAIATQLHVSRKTVSSWETGRTYPDVTMLVHISDAYQVSLDSLLKEDLGLLTHFQQQDQANLRRQRWGRWSLAVNVGAVLMYYFLAFLRVNVDWLSSLLLLNLIVLWQSGRQFTDWSPKGWRMVAIIGAVVLVNVAFMLMAYAHVPLAYTGTQPSSDFAVGVVMGRLFDRAGTVIILSLCDTFAIFGRMAPSRDEN
ncbi:helix-turn-helix domain-containing protein [Levilactobacillus acidifarinae]|uniref:helix-turn-helix domain-containing protein n=1 Tax=Levilactobacillus acidifarinae TaxID=267364 RepID=UPI00070C6887|nr:helix-turn-helix transcriptional regulator [Levilactobacillus acidifarinae]GEO69360.1 transcriptional regulator [Levilactobacillus acidifarinae]